MVHFAVLLKLTQHFKSTMKVNAKALSCVRLCDPWTVAYKAPPSMGFSRQEYWSGLSFPAPGDLPDPGIEPGSPTLQADALPSEPHELYSNSNLNTLAVRTEARRQLVETLYFRMPPEKWINTQQWQKEKHKKFSG